MSELVSNPMQVAQEMAEQHKQEQLRAQQEAAVGAWTDTTSDQSVADFEAYLQQRPYKDEQGQARHPYNGQYIGPNGAYFDKRREALETESGDLYPGEQDYREMGMVNLARLIGRFEAEGDKTKVHDLSDILMEKMIAHAEKNKLSPESQGNLINRLTRVTDEVIEDRMLAAQAKLDAAEEAEASTDNAAAPESASAERGSVSPLEPVETVVHKNPEPKETELEASVEEPAPAEAENTESSRDEVQGKQINEIVLPEVGAAIKRAQKNGNKEFLKEAEEIFEDALDTAATNLGWSEEEKEARRQELLGEQDKDDGQSKPPAQETDKSSGSLKDRAVAKVKRWKTAIQEKGEAAARNLGEQLGNHRKLIAAATLATLALGVGSAMARSNESNPYLDMNGAAPGVAWNPENDGHIAGHEVSRSVTAADGTVTDSAEQGIVPETTLTVPAGEGFENVLQQKYHLTDEQAHAAFETIRADVTGMPGVYTTDGDVRISNPGEFQLNEIAQQHLQQYIDSLNQAS
jgi:hypothetical protein